MERTKKDYIKLLDETVAFYSEDLSRRALASEFSCAYETTDDKHCAVGRCITKTGIKKIIKEGLNTSSVSVLDIKLNLDSLLMKKYQGFKLSFWSFLQALHDGTNHWDENGLTESGKIWYKRILDGINSNAYHG